jgi:hypothetical protein
MASGAACASMVWLAALGCSADPPPMLGEGELREVRAVLLEESDTAFIGDIVRSRVVSFSADGRIAVGSRMSSRVLVFSGNGAFEGVFGREGEGPGEFEQISSVGWDPSGRLWIADTGNHRVTVLDAAFDVDTLFRFEDAWVTDLDFAHDRAFVTVSKYPREGDALRALDLTDARHVTSLLDFDPLVEVPYVGGQYIPLFRVAGDSLFAGSNLSYPLHVLTLEGDTLASFGSPPPSIGEMRLPEYGEFMADMRLGHEWVRSFGVASSLWIAHDTLVVVEHRRPHPEVGGIPPHNFWADVYDRSTLQKVAEDIELPGFIVASHDDLLWILTARPPDPWTFTGYRIHLE